MARLLKLEDFTPDSAPSVSGSPPAVLTEEARLAAYEDGYKAGWDDAVAAEEESHARVSADFARALQELSFPFHEARNHVLNGISPLLTLMVEKVLPDLAERGFAGILAGILRREAEEAANRPVELVINPASRAAIERLLGEDPALPLTVIEEPSLGPGQAYVRTASGETAVDTDRVLQEIREAVKGFLSTGEEQEGKRHA